MDKIDELQPMHVQSKLEELVGVDNAQYLLDFGLEEKPMKVVVRAAELGKEKGIEQGRNVPNPD